MRNQEKSSKRTSTVVILALGILMTTMAAPAHAASPTVAVIGTSVSNGDVNVTIKNYSILPQVRSVSVSATVNGQTASTSVGVALLPYQTLTVRAGFVGVTSLTGVLTIVDEGTPF